MRTLQGTRGRGQSSATRRVALAVVRHVLIDLAVANVLLRLIPDVSRLLTALLAARPVDEARIAGYREYLSEVE